MRDIILRQKFERDKFLKGKYIERERLSYAKKWLMSDLVKVIMGPRRAGKSTFAFMLLKDIPFMYLNLDEVSFLNLKDTETLMKELHAVYGDIRTVFFDEIQNLLNWELFVNRLHREGYNVILTGSNSRLLSGELVTSLTGRHIPIEIMPFDFREFLKAVEFEPGDLNQQQRRGVLLKIMENFLLTGGFPEVTVKKLDAPEYLKILFDSVVFKNIVNRYNIRYPVQITTLAQYLIDNFARYYTIRKLKNTLGMRSVTTIEKYLFYLEEAYLLIHLDRFYFKPVIRIKSPRKNYVIDNGYITAKAIRFSHDYGRLMENLVFTELLKSGVKPNKNLFYYQTKNRKEVDFVIKDHLRVTHLIQVAYDVTDANTLQREIKALLEASNELGGDNLMVITWDLKSVRREESKTIRFIPILDWLMGEDNILETQD